MGIVMSRVDCPICNHDNPGASRFCNACGSPLDLKACPQCEAFCNRRDLACERCGHAFAVEASDAGVAPVGAEAPQYTTPAIALIREGGDTVVTRAQRMEPLLGAAMGTGLALRLNRAAERSDSSGTHDRAAILGPRRGMQNAVLLVLFVIIVAALGYAVWLPSGTLDALLQNVARQGRSIADNAAASKPVTPVSSVAVAATVAPAPNAHASPNTDAVAAESSPGDATQSPPTQAAEIPAAAVCARAVAALNLC
jgi:hypothetical protein